MAKRDGKEGAAKEASRVSQMRDDESNKEARTVADAVGTYELEILTGPGDDEQGSRAELSLRGEQGEPLGSITFYDPEVTLGHDFVSRASRPMLHLHTDMLPSVLALLNSDKPVFVELTDSAGRLTTAGDSTV